MVGDGCRGRVAEVGGVGLFSVHLMLLGELYVLLAIAPANEFVRTVHLRLHVGRLLPHYHFLLGDTSLFYSTIILELVEGCSTRRLCNVVNLELLGRGLDNQNVIQLCTRGSRSCVEPAELYRLLA